jgi:magnesium chelatase family protein
MDCPPRPIQAPSGAPKKPEPGFSLNSLIGMKHAKRALAISLGGQHPFLMEGPPGAGKTFLSLCAPGLLPNLSEEEIIEVSRIYSLFGEPRTGNFRPPFRSPHHSISCAAFLGGGSRKVTPGELSLSHKGILFLDEIPEFRRDVIEGLREPLQSGEIHLHRISSSLTLPAHFQLIATMNPCRCGFSQSSNRSCTCSTDSIRTYRKKLSGPILDRFAIYLWLERLPSEDHDSGMTQKEAELLIEKIRVENQKHPKENRDWKALHKRLTLEAQHTIRRLEEKQYLSFRKQEQILRVSLTISQIEGSDVITSDHLNEAWSLRTPDSLL